MSTPPQKSRAELIAELKSQTKPAVSNVSASDNPMSVLRKPLAGAQRFQYAVVNVGTFNSAERMTEVLNAAGSAGWELVTIYDKASNWVGSWEKGFMLLKRPVPDGVTPDTWCLLIKG